VIKDNKKMGLIGIDPRIKYKDIPLFIFIKEEK